MKKITINTEGVGMPSELTDAPRPSNWQPRQKSEMESAVEKLVEKMENMIEKDEFELWGIELGDESPELLRLLLEGNKSLKIFSVCSCGINSDSGMALSGLITDLPEIVVFDLYGNPIGDPVVLEIAKRLEAIESIKLKALVLGSVHMTDIGASAIIRLLGKMPELQVLVFSGNHITDKGAAELLKTIEGLDSTHRLSNVHLAGNKCSRAMISSIKKALKERDEKRGEIGQDEADKDDGLKTFKAWLERPLEESYPEGMKPGSGEDAAHEHHHHGHDIESDW